MGRGGAGRGGRAPAGRRAGGARAVLAEVGDLTPPPGVAILDAAEEVVAQVQAPAVEREAAIEPAEPTERTATEAAADTAEEARAS